MALVKQDEFESFLRSFKDGELRCGRDVGRTHGMECWYKGKHLVAMQSWVRDSNTSPRQWTYEIQPIQAA